MEYFAYELDEETGTCRVYHTVTGEYIPRRYFTKEEYAAQETEELNRVANS